VMEELLVQETQDQVWCVHTSNEILDRKAFVLGDVGMS